MGLLERGLVVLFVARLRKKTFFFFFKSLHLGEGFRLCLVCKFVCGVPSAL